MKRKVQVFFVFFLCVAFFSGTPPALSFGPDVTLSITPYNSPVIIQASGGTFDYTIEVVNNQGNQLFFQLWTITTYPDGSQSGPVYGPVRLSLPAGWSGVRDFSQIVSGSDPPGTYAYTAYVGFYPDIAWQSDSFSFEKVDTGGGWYEQNSGTSDVLTSVHFVDVNYGWAVGSRNTILRTTDGGDNWYLQSPPPSTNYYGVFFTDTMTGWAVGSSGKIVHTTDGGNNWYDQSSGTSYSLYGVYFADANTGWIVGGKERSFTPPNRFVLSTTDGGVTWETQYYESDRTPLKDIFFVDSSSGWAVGDSGAILSTSDGGVTWAEQSSGTPYHLTGVFFTDVITGWVVGINGILLSTQDGGITWTPLDLGIADSFSSISFSDAQNGWISGGDAGTATILRTNDGGTTWYAQDPATADYLYDIFFVDQNTGSAVGYMGTIVHTITGGE